ncbi:hypothetical protein TrVE_jg14427 [Triparma verrucosa]|uniref:SP-RING-type domain-containing protein n=1 Tax=Triparma verrucosa TaxID=1606542 RepID=A0A9W7BZF7_9STRA|nr:hypothetical protein TrVE_jg14427 [Triparma verrucosa]
MSSSSNLASNILNATADYKKGFGDVNALLQSIASEYGVDEKDQGYPQGFFGGDKSCASKHISTFRQKIMSASSINVHGLVLLEKSLNTLQTISTTLPTPGALNEEGEYVTTISSASEKMSSLLKDSSTVPKKTVETHEWTSHLCTKMSVLPSGSSSKRSRSSSSDDEIIMEDADKTKALKCPLTSSYFVNPMKNILCGHVVDKAGVAQMIKSKKAQSCPLGVACKRGAKERADWKWYEDDEEMKLKVQSFLRREKKREEKRRKEDNDDAIDVDSDGGGEEEEEDVEVL